MVEVLAVLVELVPEVVAVAAVAVDEVVVMAEVDAVAVPVVVPVVVPLVVPVVVPVVAVVPVVVLEVEKSWAPARFVVDEVVVVAAPFATMAAFTAEAERRRRAQNISLFSFWVFETQRAWI